MPRNSSRSVSSYTPSSFSAGRVSCSYSSGNNIYRQSVTYNPGNHTISVTHSQTTKIKY